MAETYEEIVKRWYLELRDDFINLIMAKFKQSKMRPEDAENIYQDVFIAIHENIKKGRVKKNTSWSSYILTIGMNLANKYYRDYKRTDSLYVDYNEEKVYEGSSMQRIDHILSTVAEAEPSIYTSMEAHNVIEDALSRTPESHATLIRLHYYNRMKDAEIAKMMPQYKSANSVKVMRNRYMRELEYRVKSALYDADLIDSKPSLRKQPAHRKDPARA